MRMLGKSVALTAASSVAAVALTLPAGIDGSTARTTAWKTGDAVFTKDQTGQTQAPGTGAFA
ncbi:hypothetical protein [Actinomadura kijaniata]|uniref:hypothetical protein n=1 Tax=Actinomadura kijaniata TaxID=46161 RepID=UPI00082DD1FD|nr:hypothetical protein [Actinomadura kijaniata]